MVSYCTVGLLALGSQRDEKAGRKGRGWGGGELRWTGKAAFNLASATSSQVSEGDDSCVCVYMSTPVFVCIFHPPVCVYVLYVSKRFFVLFFFWRRKPAGSTVVSGVPALGDETDRIKTHHNTAVIFP